MAFLDGVIIINTAVILAAGKGSRMKAEVNKQFLMLEEKPIIMYTLQAFHKCSEIHEIVIVTAEEELDYFQQNILTPFDFRKVKCLISGGKERQDSAYNGIKAASKESEIILIHDGARPFVSQQTIIQCINEAKQHGASSAGMPSKDTIKLVDAAQMVTSTPPRSSVWLTQTPQVFQYDLILQAHEKAKDIGRTATDDAMLVELMGHPVKMVEASYENIKITTPEDLVIAEQLLKRLAIQGDK